MELIPIEHFIDKIDINIKVLKDLWLEDIAVRFTEQELKSVLYHLRTLQIAMVKQESEGYNADSD